jgi:hypothetical protein
MSNTRQSLSGLRQSAGGSLVGGTSKKGSGEDLQPQLINQRALVTGEKFDKTQSANYDRRHVSRIVERSSQNLNPKQQLQQPSPSFVPSTAKKNNSHNNMLDVT